MGTNSIIRLCVKREGKTIIIASIYQHYDGNYSNVGAHLAGFMIKFEIVNGISIGRDKNAIQANGVDDLYAMYIAYLKRHPRNIGGIYLSEPSLEVSMEYVYTVTVDENLEIIMEANCGKLAKKSHEGTNKERNWQSTPKAFFDVWGAPEFEYLPTQIPEKPNRAAQVRELVQMAKRCIDEMSAWDDDELGCVCTLKYVVIALLFIRIEFVKRAWMKQ